MKHYIYLHISYLSYITCIKTGAMFISQAFSIEINFFCISHINFTTPVILNSAALHCLKCLCWNGLWDGQEDSAVCMSWSLLQHHLRASPCCGHCSRHWLTTCLGLHLLLCFCLWSPTHGPNNLLKRGIFLKQWIICGSNNTQFLLLLNTKHYKKGQFYYHDCFTGGKLRRRAGIYESH